MTSKKHKQAIADSLSSALEPPRARRPSPALNDILSQYAPPPDTVGTQSTKSTEGTQSAPAAPTRDFTRTANSIVREAVPAGVFKGKCKQLYDFLYLKTRGAIVPTRTVQLTRREIMRGSDIGSTKTLFLNLRHLREAGLLAWDERVGPHEGNIYTVFLPEETMGTHSTQGTRSTESASSPKVDRVLGVESTLSTHSLNDVVKEHSGEPKTSFKTNTEKLDDEAAPLRTLFFERFEALTKALTGKGMRAAEASKWLELFEVLETEARIAAGRTTVSSVPAFLAEHLKRRLWKLDKARPDASGGAVEAGKRASAGAPEHEIDARECPDCFGTGMYYPEGFDKGVARCPHAKLSKSDPVS